MEPGGKVIYRRTGQIEPRELRRAIADRLGRTYRDVNEATCFFASCRP